MKRREFLTYVGGAAASWPLTARAQQANRMRRVGFLRLSSPTPGLIEPFRKGLRDLGYIEGQSLYIEYGLANSTAQLPDVAAQLVRLKVDVILASGTGSVIAARNATRTIPIVFVAAFDPVAAG